MFKFGLFIKVSKYSFSIFFVIFNEIFQIPVTHNFGHVHSLCCGKI
jgi:hypothetical protein